MPLKPTLFLILAFVLGVTIGLMPFPSEKSQKAEQDAENEVCAEMAAEVKVGTATRFDYMATRCPALLLASEGGV